MATEAGSGLCRWLSVVYLGAVLLQGAGGQSYHFIVGHRNTNFDPVFYEPSRTAKPNEQPGQGNSSEALDSDYNNNSSISLGNGPSNELSQTAMDIITIVWYVATFLALAAFFMLMACSDRRCTDAARQAAADASEAPMPPPTPAPSYSEFAPPSYDSVMKLQRASKVSVFVIPFPTDLPPKDSCVGSNATLLTVNELHKVGR